MRFNHEAGALITLEWVPRDAEPQGVLAGNAFSEVETVPASE
jgi:hypothetical protein